MPWDPLGGDQFDGDDEDGLAESLLERNEGDVWQGRSGRWFTIKNGRSVPTSAPAGADTGDVKPDWEHRPTAKSQQRYVNRETGAVRYGRPGAERSPEEKKQAEADRADKLSKLATGLDTKEAEPTRKAWFGDDATEKVWPELLGSPNGTEVFTRPIGEKMQLYLDHPDVTFWFRSVTSNGDGTLHVHNEVFFLKPRAMGNGFGSDAFAAQVQGCFAQGVDAISTIAGKGGKASEKMNGFYTWARLGYDAPLANDFVRRLPKELKGAKTVQDLMATKEGAEYWKQNGYMSHMRFDLTPGSRSLQALNAYLESKGKPKIDVGEEAAKKRAEVIAARKERVKGTAKPKGNEHSARAMVDNAIGLASHQFAEQARMMSLEDAIRPHMERVRTELTAEATRDTSLTPGTINERVRNEYTRAFELAGRERFNRMFLDPANKATHKELQAEAKAQGVNPQHAIVDAQHSGWNYLPDPRDALREAYRSVIERTLRARARGVDV